MTAVTAVLVAVLVLLGIVTRQVGALEGLYNYAVAMVVSAALVTFSVVAAQFHSRLR